VRRIIYRILRNTSIVILIVGGAGLIAASPAGLNLLSAAKGVDWLKLSSIGQTYGAVSALISGVALAGVVISLILQSRELNLAREQAFRTYHFDLLRFAIDNPSFISSWGYIPPEGSSLEDVRMAGYTNMIVSFWGTGYTTGWLDEGEVRRSFKDMFRGEAGREYWEASRSAWHENADRRKRRFARIAEAEYRKAIVAGPALVASSAWRLPEEIELSEAEPSLVSRDKGLVVAFAVGFLAAGAIRLRRNRVGVYGVLAQLMEALGALEVQ
jgi:hypothetical protein